MNISSCQSSSISFNSDTTKTLQRKSREAHKHDNCCDYSQMPWAFYWRALYFNLTLHQLSKQAARLLTAASAEQTIHSCLKLEIQASYI